MKETIWRDTILLEGVRVVAAGETLTILPGTRVLARPQAALRVEGALTVRGTPEEGEVAFSAQGPSWGGIVLAGEGRAQLGLVRVKGAETALRCEDESMAELSRVEILESRHVGVLARGRSAVRAADCLIALGETGVTLQDQARARLSGCRLFLNEICGVNAMMSSRLTLRGCRLEANHTGVSLRDGAQADVRDGCFRGHQVGVYARGRVRLNVVGNRFPENRQEIELVEDAWIAAEPSEAAA